ncbi:MAG: hypothetical protein ACFFG0_44695 [Candidatus Thorarchaeota archaeon]
MEKEKVIPEFSEVRRRWKPFPWPWPWDPVPDILQFLDEKALREVTKVQIDYRIKGMKMYIEFLEDMEKFI